MQVDGTILHGWLLLCALSALSLVQQTLARRISQPLHLIFVLSWRSGEFQNVYFTPSWICRAWFDVLVTRPPAAVSMTVFGAAK